MLHEEECRRASQCNAFACTTAAAAAAAHSLSMPFNCCQNEMAKQSLAQRHDFEKCRGLPILTPLHWHCPMAYAYRTMCA